MRDQLKIRIDSGLKNQLKAYADSQGLSMSEVAESVLAEYFDPEGYQTLSLNYLSELRRDQRQLLKRADSVLETLGKFVLYYLLHTPERSDDPEFRRSRDASASKRYSEFVKVVAKSLDGSTSFQNVLENTIAKLSDFPHEATK